MYDKLVRDKIPEIIRENGEEPITHIADAEEYDERLGEKLVEESTEFRESGDIEELADVMEVFESILDHMDTSEEEIEQIKSRKAEERGGFEDRIVLDDVDQ